MQKRGIAKPFSSPGGKEAWREIILRRVPDHRVYVEPYAGSATLFFAKKSRAEVEVLADTNPNIVATYMFLRDGSDDDFAWLRQQDFKASADTFKQLQETKPATLREKAYRYKYLNLFSVRGACAKFNTSERASQSTGKMFLRNLEKFRDRLSKVQIYQADALEVMRKFDSPDTFFYLDPPWKPEGADAAWKGFDAGSFANTVKSLQGNALVSYQGDIQLGSPWKRVTVAMALGGVGGMSQQHLLINYTPPVEKNGGAGGGAHVHVLNRDAKSTAIDGSHMHLFQLPDGTIVASSVDGAHSHTLVETEADVTGDAESEHFHMVLLPQGEKKLQTTKDGKHTHETQVETTTLDGLHTHTVDIDGVKVSSMTPGEFWTYFREEKEGDEAPQETGTAPLQMRAGGKKNPYTAKNEPVTVLKPFPNEHRARQADPGDFDRFRRGRPEGFPSSVEVIFGFKRDGGSSIQSVIFDAKRWTVSTAKRWLQDNDFKAGQFEAARTAEKRYPNARGPQPAEVCYHFSKGESAVSFHLKFDDQPIVWTLASHRGTPIPGPLAKSVAEQYAPSGNRFLLPFLNTPVFARKGAVGGELSLRVDKGAVEYGIQDEHDREYFLSGAKLSSGVLRLKVEGDTEGRTAWTATLTKETLPRVLTPEAVAEGIMPPEGVSALPGALEKSIPHEYRYWRVKGEAAREIRDALVASGCVEKVTTVDVGNGPELRLLRTKIFVAPHLEEEQVTKFASVPSPTHRAMSLMPKCASEPVLVPATYADNVGTDDLVDRLAKTDRDFVVAWPDTMHARAMLAQLGRPFTFKRGAHGLLFVASRALTDTSAVDFIDKGLDFAQVDRSDDAVPESLAKIAKLYDRVLARELPILMPPEGSVHKNADGTTEERFTLGVVLAPETVDAQNDIYSAGEIRKAAHGFMEFHRNKGFMHKDMINGKVVILESYLSPVTFKTVDPKGNERTVTKGTWLLGQGYRDDQLWKQVKGGEINGLSIGGTAVRRPRQEVEGSQ